MRDFNEIDIVGDLDRDEKGNLIVQLGGDHEGGKDLYYD